MPPTFSVIIPTCGRDDLLARCLESLRPGQQRAPAELYEVIVTDDARGSKAEAMIRERFPWVRWHPGPMRGPAANRNSGVRHASGEWLVFTDDDCVASPEWIVALNDAARDGTTELLEGRTTIPDLRDNPFLLGVANENGGCYWTCNLAVRRETFLALGGFDEDFLEPIGEDVDFARRFHARSSRSRFVPAALVLHPVRRVGWRAMWKRLLMTRWSALQAYKSDERLHLAAPPLRNLARAAADSLMAHLRRTVRDIRHWNRPLPNCRAFWFAARWITFPVIFPYYLYWVYRFQKQLQASTLAAARDPA
jgi:GT2 family glycosyltransferase